MITAALSLLDKVKIKGEHTISENRSLILSTLSPYEDLPIDFLNSSGGSEVNFNLCQLSEMVMLEIVAQGSLCLNFTLVLFSVFHKIFW